MDKDEVIKLALEAGFSRDIYGIYKDDWMNPDADCLPELERFAQLIVRECADVAFLEANSRKTQKAVLQHFGVEE